MMPESPVTLERLLRDNELGWIIDMYAPRERAVPVLLEQLDKLAAEFRNRFGYNESFAPETLKAEAARNPHKVRAFLQALAVSQNSDMLMMVWRILQGLTIREVVMSYREQQTFSLSVTLARPGEGHDEIETYRTSDINDAALIRHFGITTVDGRPLFDGFFPERKK
jgi:hypothetical protein